MRRWNLVYPALPNPKLEDDQGFRVIFRKKKSSEKIIKIIRSNPDISTREIADIIDISQRAIEKNIAKLKRRKLLKRVGPDKGGHWEVIEK